MDYGKRVPLSERHVLLVKPVGILLNVEDIVKHTLI